MTDGIIQKVFDNWWNNLFQSSNYNGIHQHYRKTINKPKIEFLKQELIEEIKNIDNVCQCGNIRIQELIGDSE